VSEAVILIVDDEPGVRAALSGVLRDEGYTVEAVESGEQCLDRVVRDVVDVIVLDVWLPGLDGLATLARLRQMKIDSKVVVISGHGNIESAVKAIKMGAFDFVEKPLSLEKTVLVIRNASAAATGSRESGVARAPTARARWWAKACSCANCAKRSRWRPRRTDGSWCLAKTAPARNWSPGRFMP
jgi:DNA-binding NtrC family response regulator